MDEPNETPTQTIIISTPLPILLWAVLATGMCLAALTYHFQVIVKVEAQLSDRLDKLEKPIVKETPDPLPGRIDGINNRLDAVNRRVDLLQPMAGQVAALGVAGRQQADRLDENAVGVAKVANDHLKICNRLAAAERGTSDAVGAANAATQRVQVLEKKVADLEAVRQVAAHKPEPTLPPPPLETLREGPQIVFIEIYRPSFRRR